MKWKFSSVVGNTLPDEKIWNPHVLAPHIPLHALLIPHCVNASIMHTNMII